MCEQPDQFFFTSWRHRPRPHTPDRLSLARPFTYHSTLSYHPVREYLSQGIPTRCGDDDTTAGDATRLQSSATTGIMAARADGLTKIYDEGNTWVVALDHVDIGFEVGRSTATMGPSGSGKSTLLH